MDWHSQKALFGALRDTLLGRFIGVARIRSEAMNLSFKNKNDIRLGKFEASNPSEELARRAINKAMEGYGLSMRQYILRRRDGMIEEAIPHVAAFVSDCLSSRQSRLQVKIFPGYENGRVGPDVSERIFSNILDAIEHLEDSKDNPALLAYLLVARPECLEEISDLMAEFFRGTDEPDLRPEHISAAISHSSVSLRRDFVFARFSEHLREPIANLARGAAPLLDHPPSTIPDALKDAGFPLERLCEKSVRAIMEIRLKELGKTREKMTAEDLAADLNLAIAPDDVELAN